MNQRESELRDEISRLKKQKNALIMAHYYQRDEIQEIADFIGDSLALAQQAAKTDADIIVMCGVHFMGETAKILCPDKKVLVRISRRMLTRRQLRPSRVCRLRERPSRLHCDKLRQHLRSREGTYRYSGNIRQRTEDSGLPPRR